MAKPPRSKNGKQKPPHSRTLYLKGLPHDAFSVEDDPGVYELKQKGKNPQFFWKTNRGYLPICGAIAKSTGKHCRRPAGWGTDHFGTGRCKFHGGVYLEGPKNPAFKDGKHSKWLERLKESSRAKLKNQITYEDLKSLDFEITTAMLTALELFEMDSVKAKAAAAHIASESAKIKKILLDVQERQKYVLSVEQVAQEIADMLIGFAKIARNVLKDEPEKASEIINLAENIVRERWGMPKAVEEKDE